MQENVILGEYQSSEDEGSCDSYFFFNCQLDYEMPRLVISFGYVWNICVYDFVSEK